MPQPRTVFLFGGANGAGKTTFARAYLPHLARAVRFLNADELARGLSPFAPQEMALKAGRLLLAEIQECLRREESFALESTLSGMTQAGLLQQARAAGFRIELNYLWLPKVEIAIRRMWQRVRKGGHAVPEKDIRRRYGRSLRNLIEVYLPLADEWNVWDNENSPPLLLADSEHCAIQELVALFHNR